MAKLRIEPDGVEIETEGGGTVIDTALEGGVALPFGCLSAKCGVCRIEVIEGAEGLEPASDLEALVLEGFHCPDGVRLGCQARIRADVTVRSLFPGPDSEEDPEEENGPAAS